MKKLLKKHDDSTTPSTHPPAKLSSSSPSATPPEVVNSLIGKSVKLGNISVTITIEEVIAEGGFGVVFLARGGKKVYALKRILSNSVDGVGVAEREINILSTLTRLNCPHLLPLLDSMTTKLTPEITEILSLTPFCKGSLLQLINRQITQKTPLPQTQALRIMADIILGVAAMHSATPPILHRDLKVENVLENGGVWLLCDFGSATGKIWDPTHHPISTISEDLEKYTTLAYRSPEMVDLYSGRGPITTKSDIWSLGVLFYKLLYWTTPFGDSLLAIQSGRKLDFPPSNYSNELNLFLNYLLLPQQTLRPDIYQASELVHLLLGVANPLPVVAKGWGWNEIELHLRGCGQDEGVVRKGVGSREVVVLETTITPRQRPKATNLNSTATNLEKSVVMPPPKSPKVERREPTPSWNPFDTVETTPTATAVTTATAPDETDPFAAAPFPFDISRHQLNPFLNFDGSHGNGEVVAKGVTNYCFED